MRRMDIEIVGLAVDERVNRTTGGGIINSG